MKTLLHGSHIQDLKKLTAEDGRFGNKIFTTPSFKRALSYLPSREHNGTGCIDIQGRLFVLNLDPKNIINDFGSIYIVSSDGFSFDNHKGDNKEWVYSSTEKTIPVIYEMKFENLLEWWVHNDIFAVETKLSETLLSNPENKGLIQEIKSQNFKIVRHSYDKH